MPLPIARNEYYTKILELAECFQLTGLAAYSSIHSPRAVPKF
jgi:hypothetical protein